MTIESIKPIKKCHFCGKEVRNLAVHTLNQHPDAFNRLDEVASTPLVSPAPPSQPQLYASAPKGDINALIREKLDTMLNIKIIEMLSKNPSTSIQELQQALNPPQKTTIQELKEYHDLVYGEKEPELPYIETENQWVNIIQQFLPVIKELFKGGVSNQSFKPPLNTTPPLNSPEFPKETEVKPMDNDQLEKKFLELKAHKDFGKLKMVIKGDFATKEQLFEKYNEENNKLPPEQKVDITAEQFGMLYERVKGEP